MNPIPDSIEPTDLPKKNSKTEIKNQPDNRKLLATNIQSLETPKSPVEELRTKVGDHSPLTTEDLNRLAHELAGLDEATFAAVAHSAWNKYLEAYPHLRQYTDHLKYGGYNPLLDRPPTVSVNIDPTQKAVAAVSLDNRTLTTSISAGELSLITTTQLLTDDYSSLYPESCQGKNADLAYRVGTHETGHTYLNPDYSQIVDAADRREKQARPADHLTVGDQAGDHSAISTWQEAVVELAASEILGTDIKTLPDDLFIAHKIGNLVGDLRARGISDDEVFREWRNHPLRKDVSRMCRTLIEARIAGYNPQDLGKAVNEIILKNIEGNNMRHTAITYALIADNLDAVIQTGQVQPTLPKLDIQPEQIDVFTPQRTALQTLVAQEWLTQS